MTRDSAVITAIDDRCHSHISVVPNVSMTATMSSPTTNSNISPVDEGSSPKSSSVLSMASTSMSSDDDDFPVKPLNVYICHELLSSIRKQKVDHNSLNKNSFGSDKINKSTSITGRLTFYKDGKCILQLVGHQNSYRSGSTITSLCRWIPVSTEVQPQKNNIEKWTQRPQNKTIWPYLIVNPSSNPSQTIQQSPQLSLVKSEGIWNTQKSRTSLPLASENPVNLIKNTSCSVIMATTTNIVRRPSRKCSTTSNLFDHSTINLQHLIYQHPQCQSSQLSHNQHQTFMMYANDTIKTQRRMLLFPKKRFCRRNNKTNAISKTLSLQKQQRPLFNLETIVRYLWGRRHTTELFLCRKMLNNPIINNIASANSMNPTPRCYLTTGKRRSTAVNNGVSFSTMAMSRNKKYKMERELVIRPKPAVALISSNFKPGASYFNMLYDQAGSTGIYNMQLQSSKSHMPSSQFPTGDPWQLQSNNKNILPSSPEVVGESEVTSNKLSPYSSLGTSVASSCFLQRNISLQPLSVYSHRNLLVKQQYQPSKFGGSGVDRIKEMNVVDLDYSFTDCVPLNLSKNSVTENVKGQNNTATVVR